MNISDQVKEALPLIQMSVPFDLEKSVPVIYRVGSHAHGTYVPPEDKFGIDDVDLMVICIPPPNFVLGMKRWEHGQYKHGKLDVVFYDWGKWIRMLQKSNPNVIGTLWNEPADVWYPEGQAVFEPLDWLRFSRGRIVTKQMYPSFVGYAKGQLYKMTHFAHEGYMGAKRKALVEEFGYDVKNAAHLIRLLRMACEAMETGKLQVRRPDADELLAIKRGEWTLVDVVNEAERLFQRAEIGFNNTTIPAHTDDMMLQKTMVHGYSKWWGWNIGA